MLIVLKLRKPCLEYFTITVLVIITHFLYAQKLFTKHNALLTRNPFLLTLLDNKLNIYY